MEQTLGLMCGAGALPARMAETARRRGWRVAAFTFDAPDAVRPFAERVVPARLDQIGAVLAALQADRITSVLFSGRFSMGEVVRADAAGADAFARTVGERAGSRIDAALAGTLIATLAGFGIEVLDQRPFFDDALAGAGVWSTRAPTDAEAGDIRRGLAVARMIADARVGQTVVVRHGAVVAVEAVEGTTEAIRRGAANAGPGAVVVKAVARDHDYRFDVPAIGLETLEAAARGGIAVIAVEAGRVAVLDRAALTTAADAADVA
ncbi:MAG: UDP-2,3-diacylglucosamine diphosphatase LpxI, partial [Candidatus Rokubacteria bacterium]|nr:UDP-2,3-diacylglucosamine diphosphatase LpxI [Candidatus Rokubacteria bacterium]